MNITTTPAVALIEKSIENVPGWTPLDQLLVLFSLVQATSNLRGDVLELGSWCGRSASVLGLATKISKVGKVYCIDLFPTKSDWKENADGTYTFQVIIDGKTYVGYGDQTVWAEPFERDIRPIYEEYEGTQEAFNKAIAANNLTDIVSSHKGDMESFFKIAPKDLSLRLAFIDGDHSYDAVSRDIQLIEEKLLPGGWMCFDDAFSHYDGVNEAIQKHILGSNNYENAQQFTRKFFAARKKTDHRKL